MSVYYYSMGHDITVAPNSSFSLSVQRVATGAAVNITGAEISTHLGTNKKIFVSHKLNDVKLWNTTTPGTTMDPAGWNTTHSFLDALQDALKEKTDAAGWGTYIDFVVSLTTSAKLTIRPHDLSTNIYIQVQNADTQWILGHSTTYNATATTGREGLYYMKYLVPPAIQYISDVKGPYDAESISSIATPSSGIFPYGLSRGYCEQWFDFSQVGEPKNRIRDYLSTSYPFGFGFLFEHCRQGYPFIVYGWDTYSPICFLRDGQYEPKRMFADYDDLWRVDFKTIYAGQI